MTNVDGDTIARFIRKATCFALAGSGLMMHEDGDFVGLGPALEMRPNVVPGIRRVFA